MKKIIISLFVSIVCAVTSWAYTLNSDTVFSGSGVTLRMNADGTCQLISAETGNWRGRYDIPNNYSTVEPGCSNINVEFYFNGESYRGTIIWPLQEGLSILFEGVLLRQYN